MSYLELSLRMARADGRQVICTTDWSSGQSVFKVEYETESLGMLTMSDWPT
jgi:hypothetical protein